MQPSESKYVRKCFSSLAFGTYELRDELMVDENPRVLRRSPTGTVWVGFVDADDRESDSDSGTGNGSA